MRVKLTAAEAKQIAHGPGKFLIRNHTNTALTWVEVGVYGPPGSPITPLATEAAGFEIGNPATPSLMEVALGPEEALTGIVKAAGAEQEFEVLRLSPRL